MPKHTRRKRSLSKRIVVYCEGGSEEHYVNGLKAWIKEHDPSVNIKIRSECIHGGGYKSFFETLNKEPDSNCVARIAILDLDRYANHAEERSAFNKLVGLSRKSQRGRVPCILIGNYPDFEHFLCCHDPQYKGTDAAAFLKKVWGYSSLEKCKADPKIWNKAHTGNRSHEQALNRLDNKAKPIGNDFKISKKTHSVELKGVLFNEEALSGYGSNFKDLFKAIGAVA